MRGLDFSLLGDVKFPGKFEVAERDQFWVLTVWWLDCLEWRLFPLPGRCSGPGES